ncbi:MAG: endonuclease MutS2 [Pleomorphochaeta sp.]
MKLSKKTLIDLGFYQVLENIENNLLYEDSKISLYKRSFFSEKEEILKFQDKLEDFIAILDNPETIKPNSFPPIVEIFEIIKKNYQSIDGSNLYNAASFINSAEILYKVIHSPIFDNKESNNINYLLSDSISEDLINYKNEVFYALDESGKVKDSHPLIRSLVKKVEKSKRDRSSFTKEYIKNNKVNLQNDLETVRDDRIVLPVKNDAKSKVQGFVHGSSASGNTLFIEPYKMVEYNNLVVLAEQQIQIEIAKIYAKLNSLLIKCINELKTLSSLVIKVDIIYAFARWVIKNNCTRVDLSENKIKLLYARHPLLGEKAVPITLDIENDIKCIVISGPNAGGKTVTIKTVGLFSALNQFIGYIPAEEGSSLPIFDKIYTDIGDEQSIEQELSTFSGHMNSLAKILRNCTNNSLVILDELGSATDPIEGGAIAQSVVDYLLKNSKYSLITSHLASLKHKAYVSNEMLNASMEFNEDSHLPTFRVVCGLPGDSHAIDTAIRMKLPKQVIKNAQNYLGDEQLQIGEIVKRLENERVEVEKRLLQLDKQESELKVLKTQVELYKLKLNQKEHILKKEQSTELSRYINQSRKDLENLVNKLVTGEITKEKTREVKKFINKLNLKEESVIEELEKEEVEISFKREPFVIKEGLTVLCGNSKREGVVLKSDGKKKWIVQVGSLRISFKEKDLYQAEKTQVEKKVSVSYSNQTPRPKANIDVRGYTLEEALDIVRNQLEACLVHNFSSFSIIHGYGDGILQKGIHQYLKQQSQVKDYRFAIPSDGGMGKTFVML